MFKLFLECGNLWFLPCVQPESVSNGITYKPTTATFIIAATKVIGLPVGAASSNRRKSLKAKSILAELCPADRVASNIALVARVFEKLPGL